MPKAIHNKAHATAIVVDRELGIGQPLDALASPHMRLRSPANKHRKTQPSSSASVLGSGTASTFTFDSVYTHGSVPEITSALTKKPRSIPTCHSGCERDARIEIGGRN